MFPIIFPTTKTNFRSIVITVALTHKLCNHIAFELYLFHPYTIDEAISFLFPCRVDWIVLRLATDWKIDQSKGSDSGVRTNQISPQFSKLLVFSFSASKKPTGWSQMLMDVTNDFLVAVIVREVHQHLSHRFRWYFYFSLYLSKIKRKMCQNGSKYLSIVFTLFISIGV